MADSPTITTYRWSSDRSEDQFPVEDPATGLVITTVQGGGVPEIDAAVQAAHRAFGDNWRWRTPAERARLLLRGADVLEAHADELAELVSRENGKPVADARLHDVGFLVGIFRFFGSLAGKLPSEFYDKGSIYASTVLEPLGVVGEIIPFNWPPIHAGGKIAPALAVGDTVVLKPSEAAPLTVIRLAELLNTVLPPDVLHVVPGMGRVAGQALVAHPLVRKVSFTGSTPAGAAIAKAAADNITPAVLELGGKNAFIVYDDADLDRAVRDALDGGFYNKGEACTAASRVLVHRDAHDAFVERLAAAVSALRVGSGADPATHIGPVVSKAQQQKVLNYIRIGEAEGAKIAAQAALPADPALAGGFFVPPTLFTGVTRDMRVATEEIFGPVVTVTAFNSEDEAVAIANEPQYGLLAGIYTRDSERAFRTARVQPWPAAWVDGVRAAMPARYRALADAGAGLGLRQGEAFGLAVDDADFLHRVVHIRRQIRIVGSTRCFAPPKGGKERDIPLPDSIALRLSAHIAACPPVPVSLPWKVPGGRPETASLLFTTPSGAALHRSSFTAVAWQPALRGTGLPCSRENGFHALRHYFASACLYNGVDIRALAAYLGHHDPGFTLRTYVHLMPSADDRMRQAVDAVFASSDGPETARQEVR